MATELSGRTIALIATDGVEQVELEQPRAAMEQAGATTHLVSTHGGQIQAMNQDINPGDKFTVDRQIGDVTVNDYDGIILPGGTINPDRLRIDETAVRFVRSFAATGKPIAAICHGPWTLVEADLVRGRTLTSWPSVRTDIRNAGGNVVDQEVVQDGNLVTSRKPDDLPAFCATTVEVFAKSGQ